PQPLVETIVRDTIDPCLPPPPHGSPCPRGPFTHQRIGRGWTSQTLGIPRATRCSASKRLFCWTMVHFRTARCLPAGPSGRQAAGPTGTCRGVCVLHFLHFTEFIRNLVSRQAGGHR